MPKYSRLEQFSGFSAPRWGRVPDAVFCLLRPEELDLTLSWAVCTGRPCGDTVGTSSEGWSNTRAVSNLTYVGSWPKFEQEAGPGTSKGLFDLDFSL